MATYGETITLPEAEAETEQEKSPLYSIILFNDEEHTYGYVIDMMTKLFDKSQQEAFEIAYEVDYIGQTVVKTCEYEEAVVGCKRILNFGPDPLLGYSRGSMKAIVQEAEG